MVRANRWSELMVRILSEVASRSDGASVQEIVELAGQPGRSGRGVVRASVSRTLRRLWRQGAVELHDSRWVGAGRTMSGLQHRARNIALEAKANAEAFYKGALKVRNYLRKPGDPWGSANACVAAKEREAVGIVGEAYELLDGPRGDHYARRHVRAGAPIGNCPSGAAQSCAALMHLPAPLSQCSAPESFSPSQLAFGSSCLLRTVLASAPDVPTLTTHPAAAIEKAFHNLLEMAVRGQIARAGSPTEDVLATLEKLLDDEQARMSRNWPPPAPELRAVFPPLVWRRKQRVVLDLAAAYLSGRVPSSVTGDFASVRTIRELPDSGTWPELHIAVPELRLSGRIDLLQREAGEVIVRDLKTGRVVTEDGEILPHIELQMRLYGLMARRIWPQGVVRLIVDYGKRSEVERRVLVALQQRFLTPERLAEFTRLYVAETNRLRSEHGAKLVNARRELEALDRRQMQILGYLNGGFGEVEAWRVEVRQNELRRAELNATVTAAAAQPPPPALHPNMAGVFEQKIRALAAALEHEDIEQRESARTTLRGFIDQIVIPPGDALLQVIGNLGEMLTAAGAPREAAAVGNSGCGGSQPTLSAAVATCGLS
jgi:hypothetical protein